MGFGYGGWYAPPPFLMIPQGGFFPFGSMVPPPMMLRGPLLPPPPEMMAPRPAVNNQQGDPVKAGQRVTVGDRLLRAGNVKKAEERYQQATRSAPDLAAPESAWRRSRSFEPITPMRHSDYERRRPPSPVGSSPRRISSQSLASQTEFARHIARLETHLQSHPDDRDAWLVLGRVVPHRRTAKAADVFQRLNDPKRKPDVALAAFLDASNQINLKPRICRAGQRNQRNDPHSKRRTDQPDCGVVASFIPTVWYTTRWKTGMRPEELTRF